MATKADAEFQRVLAGDPGNRVALQSLASLHYQMAQGIDDQDQKSMRLDESAGWYRKLNEADPSNKEGWYSLAVIGWNKVYPARVKVRKQLGMRPDDPGPIPNAQIREDLRARNGAAIDDGIANLERALQIDPAYDDAMAYLNLMYRERADLEPSKELWARDTAMAGQWVQKSLEEKKRKAQQVPGGSFSRTLPPPAPNTPNQIRVSGNVQAANLIRTVDPIYPELARSARIQGTVRFQVTIDDQGRIANAQLVSGHPLLVAAAQEALRQWLYKPTLLNVTVITVVDVNFTLPPGA